MGKQILCPRCRKGQMINGKCSSCGYSREQALAANALPAGHHLNRGRYRIIRVLGGGGYGITYEALDLKQNKSVALKEFFPVFLLKRCENKVSTACIDPQKNAALDHNRFRFIEEAHLLLSLTDVKEIVNVFDCFEENGTAYYTMELLNGLDMQKHLQRSGRMSWEDLQPILIQLLRALSATHQRGFIHRDITPDNIFLLKDHGARLIDFGNARRYTENQQLTAVVKDNFSPREQYSRKGNQGPWTDIYSLCVTVYYAMTGILPQKATERTGEQDQLPMLQNVPAHVSRAIQMGMDADEHRRYQTIADFARDLFPDQYVLDSSWVPRRTTIPANGAEKQRSSNTGGRSRQAAGPMLVCVQGQMQGRNIPLQTGAMVSIGRQPGKTLAYPEGTSGVSRNQCSVLRHTNGGIYVRDDGSSFGTAVNGMALPSGQWRLVRNKDIISFGKEIYIVYNIS